MPQGDFGDNLASFVQGATGEIFRRKEEQRQLKQNQEDSALKLKLNLFGSMLNDPDNYTDEHLRTFANLIDKDHKISQLIGQNVQDAINPILAQRQQLYANAQQNQALQQMLPGGVEGYSPRDIKQNIPHAFNALLKQSGDAAQQEFELKKLLFGQSERTARESISSENRRREQESKSQNALEVAKTQASSRENAAKTNAKARLESRNIGSIQATPEQKMEQQIKAKAADYARQRVITEQRNAGYLPVNPKVAQQKYEQYYKEAIQAQLQEIDANTPSTTTTLPGYIPPEERQQFIGTTTTTSIPKRARTTTTLPPSQESQYYEVIPNR
jgi:hypothetical protein